MSKHNFYPTELKIQIIERFLNSESAASLREEFQISSSRIVSPRRKNLESLAPLIKLLKL